MKAFWGGDRKNKNWVEENNEWIVERCGKKSEEWAEREAVNQRRKSRWRERGEVSQMEKEKEESLPAAAAVEEEEGKNMWWGNGSDE